MVDDIKKYSIPRTRAELMHSRPMDVHQACYHKGMWELRDKLYTNNLRPLMEYESNAVKRQLQKLLVDVFQAWFHDPTLLIAVSFNNNDYVLDKRYNKIHITQKIIFIIKQLIRDGYLYYHKGMPKRDAFRVGPSYLPRIWPSELLIEEFKQLKFNLLDIRSHDIGRETIILNKKVPLPKEYKDKYKNVPIDYSDTSNIRAMRLIMTCYNELLRTTHIDIANAEKDYVSSYNEWGNETKCFIKPFSFVYRSFSDSTFNKGGRIYGAWWERCASIHRQHIYINGNPTVEIDYNSTHPAILYQMKGLNYFQMSGGRDLYALSIPLLDEVTDDQLEGYTRKDLEIFKRFLVKKLTLFALNAESEESLWSATVQGITAEHRNPESAVKRPPSSILPKISNDFLASVFTTIKQKHYPIEDYFLSGIAPELQRIDSNITSNLIEHFTALKVPILTIHDSYIVEKKWGQTLINAMQSAWMEEMSRIKENPFSKPKRSRYLYRLTSRDNHYHFRNSLEIPIELEATQGYQGGRTKLKQIGDFEPNHSTANYWSQWNSEAVEVKASTIDYTVTERYQMSLKRFQDWLREPDSELGLDDLPDIKERYENLKSSINIDLYQYWKHEKPLWMGKEEDMDDDEIAEWLMLDSRHLYE